MTALYDLAGLRMRVTGLADAAVPDINTKLHAFGVPEDLRPADLEVAIGPFEPEREGCLALDRRYWARPGYLYLEEGDKGMAWRAELAALERAAGEPLRLRYHLARGPRGLFRLFPDLVMHLYVLWPVLECELAARGLWLVHAGAVERDGRARLIAGRGGVNKTAIVAALVRRGWRPMGDDFALLASDGRGGARVRAFPTSPRWLAFHVERKADERYLLIDKLRLLRFLYRRRDVPLTLATEARLEAVALVDVEAGRTAPERTDAGPAAARRLALNCRMERTSYVGHGTVLGRFLEAYRYVVPATDYGRAWDGLEGALETLTAGARWAHVAAGEAYDPRVADLIESL